jgi:hypothetical protein
LNPHHLEIFILLVLDNITFYFSHSLITCTTHLKILMLEILCLWDRMIPILFLASYYLTWECMNVWKKYW